MLIRQKRRGNNKRNAVIAQLVEHFLGKEEVTSSNLVNSSRNRTQFHLKLRAFWLSVFFRQQRPLHQPFDRYRGRCSVILF